MQKGKSQTKTLHFKLKLYENRPMAPLEGPNNATILLPPPW